jgi:hypothetical protein
MRCPLLLSARWKGWVFLLSAILLSGCSHDAELSPEQQIEAFLDRAEAAVESRSLAQSTALIADNYHDENGRGLREMKRLLMGYFLRHKTIHILKKIDQISLADEGVARVVLYAGMVGSQVEILDDFSQWRGDLVRLEIDLVLEDGDQWRLLRADWRRASRGELFL